MIIILHIAIALSSIITSTILAFSPSMRKLYASYSLIGLTLLSGTYLVVSMHTPLLRVCEEGLFYLSIALGAALVGNYRLATAKAIANLEK